MSVDLDFFRANGYVVIPDAAPSALLDEAAKAIWQFGEMDPHNPQTWYPTPERANGLPELNGAGMVELYHHPALWATRQWPRIYEAFATLWQTQALWVSIDRCNFNPPNRGDGAFAGFIHWDIDTSLQPLPFGVQGFLSLSDCPAGSGGFQCVPALYAQLDEWIAAQPEGRDPFCPDLAGFDIVEVPTQKGDLLIWNSLLPHGTSANTSAAPRLAQYLSMAPASEGDAATRAWRIEAWLHRRAPEGDAFPGDPRHWERRHGTTAALTPLGRRLLGLDSWQEKWEPESTQPYDQKQGRRRGAPGFSG